MARRTRPRGGSDDAPSADAAFVGAAATPGGGPAPGPPEIAIAGRSNVGKSSLVNVLLGRRGLARTSRTPGRTRQVNFFRAREGFLVVDLPGYGFAVGPEAERRAWGPLVETYLRERPTLRGVLVVVDARRGIDPAEEQLLAYLAALAVPSVVVATKVDKLARARAGAAVAAIGVAVPAGVPVLAFSAQSGEGRVPLWRTVSAWAAAPARRAPP